MEKIQAINELYNSIYAALKANSDLRKYVTNIYDYLPKQVTIPYLIPIPITGQTDGQ
ncbi:hypothetical protein [Wolbachia endosymbiont (group A) of Alloplasta piceator]|uniref:hypothetical protein n=1 Tax=Wolbachia endosymbiont (group A) of Alloplasta piceator TaxID=3066188 RepID=UPI00333FF382